MKREFRDLWYKRCTDGTYRQTTYKLANPGNPAERCCLGVAHAVGQELNLIPSTTTPFQDDGSSRGYLSDSECEKIGLKYEDQREFSRVNDGHEHGPDQYYPRGVLAMIQNYPVED